MIYIYKKGEFVKCKSIKVATLRGWFTYALTVGKLYELLLDSDINCNIINDKNQNITFGSDVSEELFMTKDEIREEKLNQILDEK
jgi:hypothetical protein